MSCAASSLPAIYSTFRGRSQEWTIAQHCSYGPIVRLRPNELSFITASAWKDIYSFRQGQQQMTKTLRTKPINGRPNMMSATDAEHAYQQKLLSHAFSEHALREQKPVLHHYADLLVQQLRTNSFQGKRDIDIVEWLTFATFDIIGDLSFGKSSDNLANGEAHPWVATFKHSIMQGLLFVAFRSLWGPFFDRMWQRLLSPYVQKKRHQQFRYAQIAVQGRLQCETGRPDFITHCLRQTGAKAMTQPELESIFTIVALAGCESPSTALSGTLYYLLKNPGLYQKLKEEVRSVQAESDITLLKVTSMPYLKAVLKEALRIYPPVPSAMDRVVPGEGAMVCILAIDCVLQNSDSCCQISGHWVPPGTWVGVPQLAASHSVLNFANPDQFAPERYLNGGDERFKDDAHQVVQPFSVGRATALARIFPVRRCKYSLQS